MLFPCDRAQKDKFGRVVCITDENTGGEHPLCPYQRYCSQAHEWQVTPAYSACDKRRKKNG